MSAIENRRDAENIDVDVCNEALAEFIFGCNIPFSIVESQYFIKFVKSLNPSFKPPIRKTLSTTLLDKIHNKLEKECAEKLQGTESILLMDGWKNSANNSKLVVSAIHNVNEDFLPPLFIST